MSENTVRNEKQFWSAGTIPEGSPEEALFYQTLFVEWDARSAEAAAETGSWGLLDRIRALLFRGRFTKVRDLLSRAEPGDSPSEKAELLLERAREAGFQGRWSECRDVANEALTLQPAPVTRMTLIQVLSMAEYELGSFAACLTHLETIDSFSRIFHRSPNRLYGQVLRLKIRIRDRAAAGDKTFVLTDLHRLWREEAVSGRMTLDSVLTLLRAEVDVRRELNLPFLAYAFACERVANQIGDTLYRAFAQIDQLAAAPVLMRSQLTQELAVMEKELTRIHGLLQEIHGQEQSEASTTTGLSLRNRSHDAAEAITLDVRADALRASKIFHAPSGLLFSVEEFRVVDVTKNVNYAHALALLGSGGKTKDGFFRALWNHGRFASHLHDGVIRTFLSRLRKATGVEIESESGTLRIRDFQCLE